MLCSHVVKAEVVELNWYDLVPEEEIEYVRESVRRQNQLGRHDESDTPVGEQDFLGSVRPELNNQQVKIPGFVIPIEGTSTSVKEFLLVPFYGACIHVPPPPQNQIIHVVMDDFQEIRGMWEVVYVTGEMKTESLSHDLAQVGYRINGSELHR